MNESKKALHLNRFWNLKGANKKRQKQSSVLEFFQENCSKIESAVVGPDGDAGIGCGVGVGLGGTRRRRWHLVRCRSGTGRKCGSRRRRWHLVRRRSGTSRSSPSCTSLNPVVDDCVAFFDSFRDRHVPLELPSFLYTEFLGGAIALLITLHRGDFTTK
nr:caffeoylshikimate esterase-like [Ipomoea trifida]